VRWQIAVARLTFATGMLSHAQSHFHHHQAADLKSCAISDVNPLLKRSTKMYFLECPFNAL